MSIKYDKETLGLLSLFERISKAKVRDCFVDENKLLIFIVEQHELAKAIGKAGSNARMLENVFKRKIRIIEYNPDIKQFIKNIVYPIPVAEIKQMEEDNAIYIITPQDSKSRGLLIGRAAQSLRYNESIAQRYFPIKELKVE
ncbi:NusA-like transcription termination signal-binding factor [Candidatus Woesearchaeota archaeon]|nr:NusA-like transcription termination signal-binding factor [Candidatus Woesearchaeota archaeon]